VPGVIHTPEPNRASDSTAKSALTLSNKDEVHDWLKDEVPDWVPVYPFAQQENIFLRRGAGSISFETENSDQHLSGAYTAKLNAAVGKCKLVILEATGLPELHRISNAL
jgi:hypothetical protein